MDSRKKVARILAALLADEFVLSTKTRNFHWNVFGPRFPEYHAFFETQYEELDQAVDEVAERIRALGFMAPGSLQEFGKMARLKEQPATTARAPGLVRSLLEDHEALVRRLREDAQACVDEHKDAGTGDFLTGLLARHEKMAWALRAMTQAPAARAA